MTGTRKICVGLIAGAHGVKGLVRLRSFTEVPKAIKRYKPLTDESGATEFRIKIKNASNDFFIAEIEGVKDRGAAEALRNTKLYVSRSALPKLSRKQFYESDFAGLAVRTADGKNFGTVLAMHNYGGGPFLEIQPPQAKSFMLPFNKDYVPEVDIEAGRIIIDPPEGWIEASPSKRHAREGGHPSSNVEDEAISKMDPRLRGGDA